MQGAVRRQNGFWKAISPKPRSAEALGWDEQWLALIKDCNTADEPASDRPRCCASRQGPVILCEARLGNCSMHCSTSCIHAVVAVNRLPTR
jgi:hypothetical protein